MTRALIVSGLLIAVLGCGTRERPPDHAAIANTDAVRPLRIDENPYRIIYSPPEDLAKQPTSGPASPRRE
jgi:hypothetical protein